MTKMFFSQKVSRYALGLTFILSSSFLMDEACYASKKHHRRIKKAPVSFLDKQHVPRSVSHQTTNSENPLKKVIEEALAYSPNIVADIAAKHEAAYRIEQANSRYFPTVDVKGATGYTSLKDRLRQTVLNGGAQGTVEGKHSEMALTFRQPLFEGFDTIHRVEKASREKNQAEHKIRETKEVVAYSVFREYVTVRRFQRLVRLAEENIKNHQQILEKVRSLVQAGKTTIADLQHVSSRLADAKSALEDIRGDLDSSCARFTELLGYDPHDLKNAQIPPHFLPSSLEKALSIARRSSPSLALGQAIVKVAESDLNVVESAFYPSFALESDVQRSFNPLGEKGTQNTVSALAVVRYNLFNGGNDVAKTREYAQRVTEAKYKAVSSLRQIIREVTISWTQMLNAHKQSEALRESSQAKDAIRQTYLDQFTLGKRSFLEILDVTHEAFLAKGSLITADATEDVAGARLLASMGVLVDTYLNNRLSNDPQEIRHPSFEQKAVLEQPAPEKSFGNLKEQQDNDSSRSAINGPTYKARRYKNTRSLPLHSIATPPVAPPKTPSPSLTKPASGALLKPVQAPEDVAPPIAKASRRPLGLKRTGLKYYKRARLSKAKPQAKNSSVHPYQARRYKKNLAA